MIKVKLSEICDLQNGYAFKSSDYVENSNTLSCRMSNIRLGGIFDIEYNPRFLPDSFADQYKGFLLKDGDLVIAMTDLANDPKLLGVPTLVQTDGRNILLNQRVGKLIIKDSSKVDNKYLQHVLNDPKTREYYRKFASGGLQINLGKSDLLNVEIPLPPLAEQRRIASILDQADELRQKRQQAIEKLDQLLQATFIDMFGDPVSNPKGWDLVNLESLLAKKLISGAYFPKETYVNSGGVPMVHMGDVFYGVVKPDNLKQVNISNEEIKKYKITNKDILIARRSLTYDGAAKACLVECSNQDMIFESSLIRLSPNLVKILPEFLYHYLNNNDVRNKFIIPYITKSTISGINQANLNKVTVLLPPLAKQEKFIEICDKFKQLGKTLTQDLSKLDELFKSLQNQAFNGTL